MPVPFKYISWQQPGITNKSLFNWQDINADSLDNTMTHGTTYNLNFQQEILSNLNFQASWFRQQLIQTQDSPENQASATAINVDTNQYLPNGQPNPHLGQPFVDVYQADVYSSPEINNNYRAMLDYEPDLRDHVPHWLKWLGHHRFLGIFQQHDDIQTALRFRPAIDGGDPNYLPTAATLANAAGYSIPSSNSTIEQWFYLGGSTAVAPGDATTNGPGYYNRPDYGGPKRCEDQHLQLRDGPLERILRPYGFPAFRDRRLGGEPPGLENVLLAELLLERPDRRLGWHQ